MIPGRVPGDRAGDGVRPEAVPHLVEREVERVQRGRWNGSASWTVAFALEVADRDPDERQALTVDQRPRRTRSSARPRGSPGSRPLRAARVWDRSPSRSRRSAAEGRPFARQSGGRIRLVTRSTSPTRVASSLLRGRPVPERRWSRSSRVAGRPHRAGVAVVGERVQVPAGCPPSTPPGPPRGEPATSPTVVIPNRWSLAAVTGPTPQSRSTGSGWRNASSRSGGTTSRPSGLATPLATLARNFVRATPTVMGRPTSLAHVAAQPRGDLRGRARRGVAARRRRGRPRRSKGPRRAAWCPRRRGTPPARLGVGRHARRGRRSPAGTSRRAGGRPSPVRTPYALAS